MPSWTILLALGVWAFLVCVAIADAVREEQRQRYRTSQGRRLDRRDR